MNAFTTNKNIRQGKEKLFSSLLIFSFSLVAMFSCVMVSVVIYYCQAKSIRTQMFNELESVRDEKMKLINLWLQERENDISVIAQDQFVIEACEKYKDNGQVKNGSMEILDCFVSAYRYHDVFILPPASDVRIASSLHRKTEFPLDVKIRDSVVRYKKKVFSDVFHNPNDNSNMMLLASPIVSATGGELIGISVMTWEMAERFYSELLGRERLGETGEDLLVDRTGLVQSSLRFRDDAILNYRIRAEPARRGAAGEVGRITTKDYRHEPVMAAYGFIKKTQWGIVVKQDISEINAPIDKLAKDIAIISLLVLLIAGLVGGAIASRLVAPAIRASEDKYLALISSATDGIVTVDQCGDIVSWNDGAQKIFGYHEGEILGEPLTTLIPARFVDAHRKGMQRFLSTGEATIIGTVVELIAKKKDGSEFVMEMTLSSWESDKRVYCSGIIRDISEQKISKSTHDKLNRTIKVISECNKSLVHSKTEDELLNNTCRNIVESAGYLLSWIGYVVEGEPKDIVPVCQAGFDDGYLENLTVTWADTEQGRGPTGTAIRTRKPTIVQNIAENPTYGPWRKQALVRGYRSSVSLPLVIEGHVLGILNIYSNESEAFGQEEVKLLCELASDLAYGMKALRTKNDKVVLEAQLQRAQKLEAVGQLASGIAHEFNNVLMGISGFAELLEHQVTDNVQMLKDISRIRKMCDRGGDLSSQMLAFSRGKEKRSYVFDIHQVIKNIPRLFKNILPKNIHLKIDASSHVRMVYADPGQMEQCLVNLIINARDAMPTGGAIIIGTEVIEIGNHELLNVWNVPPGTYCQIAVYDSGTGMSQDVLKRIFDPFFTTKDVGQGTGLGLSVVYGIIKDHQGSIIVDSEMGRGTMFTITLPLHETSLWLSRQRLTVRSSDASMLHSSSANTETILLVDGESMSRNAMCSFLESEGYEAVVASDFDRANELFAQYSASILLLITVVAVPGGSGSELYKRMLDVNPHLKVVYLSEDGNDSVGMIKEEIQSILHQGQLLNDKG